MTTTSNLNDPTGEGGPVDLETLSILAGRAHSQRLRQALDVAVPRALSGLEATHREAILYALASPEGLREGYPSEALLALEEQVGKDERARAACPDADRLHSVVLRWLLQHHTSIDDEVRVPDFVLPWLERVLDPIEKHARLRDWAVVGEWPGFRRHPALALRIVRAAMDVSEPVYQTQAVAHTHWVLDDPKHHPQIAADYKDTLARFPSDVLESAGVEVKPATSSRLSLSDKIGEAKAAVESTLSELGTLVWEIITPTPMGTRLEPGFVMADDEASNTSDASLPTLAERPLGELTGREEHDAYLRVRTLDDGLEVSVTALAPGMAGRRYSVQATVTPPHGPKSTSEGDIELAGARSLVGTCLLQFPGLPTSEFSSAERLSLTVTPRT